MLGSKPRNAKEYGERRRRANQWRKFRQQNLLTQKQLAAALGVSLRTIALIEAGHVTPRYRTLARFEAVRRRHEREAQRNGG